MTRRCPVIDCDSMEDQTPGHRFPMNKEQVQIWKDSLKLKEFPIELLQTKFYVCQNHFSSSGNYAEDEDDTLRIGTNLVPKLNLIADNEARVAESAKDKGIEDSAYIRSLDPTWKPYDTEPNAENLQASCALLVTQECRNHFSSGDYPDDDTLMAIVEPKLDLIADNEAREAASAKDEGMLQAETPNEACSTYAATDSESIEIVSPIASVESSSPCPTRLALPVHDKNTRSGNKEDSASFKICHDIHFYDMIPDEVECCSENFQERCALAENLQESCAILDAQDFMVVNVDEACRNLSVERHHNCISCKNSSPADPTLRNAKRTTTNATSATDSDIEILMSEEVINSDWSAAENNEDLLTLSTSSSSADARANVLDLDETAGGDNFILGYPAGQKDKADELILNPESTPPVDEAFESMSQTQLVSIAKSQAAKIRNLEKALTRYHDAQSSLFIHIDALRTEYEKELLILIKK